MTEHAAPRPMRRDAVRNQRLVLDAARRVVAEFGLDASMELIASRAGVGVGTVYRHFPNKDALVEELVRLIHGDLVEIAEQALARGDGTGLEEFLRALGRSLGENRGYGSKLVGPTKADFARRLRALIAELFDDARRHGLLRPDVALGDVMTTVWAIRGIVAISGSVAPNAWERHLDIQLAGMRAAEPPSARAHLTPEELVRIGGISHSVQPPN